MLLVSTGYHMKYQQTTCFQNLMCNRTVGEIKISSCGRLDKICVKSVYLVNSAACCPLLHLLLGSLRTFLSSKFWRMPLLDCCGLRRTGATDDEGPDQPVQKLTKEDATKLTNDDWAKRLTADVYKVTREHGTERAFTGKLYKHKGDGVYVCSNCGAELFSSKTKYDSGSGWPSFYEAIAASEKDGISNGVIKHDDTSAGMVRTEVLCKNCNAHLGHVFDDGPKPTGLRYCINSASLKFEGKK